MLRQVLRELRFHPSRFVATVIAIAISVAFMAGSSILVATESNGMQRVQSLPISTADVVVSVGPDADRAAVRKVLTGAPGVAVPEPGLTMTTSLRHDRASALTGLIGLPSEPLRWSRLAEGRWPQATGELALSRAAASGLNVSIGDRVETSYDDIAFTVVGLTDEPRSLFLQTGYVAPATFRLIGLDPALGTDTWIVKGAPGSDPAQLAQTLNAALSSVRDAEAKPADQLRTEAMKQLTGEFDAFRNLLWAFAAIAAVVGMITIANTFTILLAQRRRQIGHWEGDTVMGADQRHCVLTLVERVTGYLVMKKLVARNKEQAATALARAIEQLQERVRTITLDNGTEFHDYEKVEQAYPVKFYFATPYHSWERGTNENTNGLIRQYLPKGMCMRHINQADCDAIAAQLNDRPRQRLGFRTPSEAFARS